MKHTPESVLKQLQINQYAPVYFLQGEEPYYIDLISDYIEANALDESQKSFNQFVIYGRDTTISDILTHARRFPMMSDRQVVLVKEAQELPDLKKENAQKLLVNFLEQPTPSTILVFCYKYKTIDKRKALGKAIEKAAIEVVTKKIYDNQIPLWIKDYTAAKDLEISEKATQMLAEYIGNNLERLSHEIDKVLINLEGKSKIESEDVQKYVGISKEFNVFELQKALAVKDVMKSNQIINYFSSNLKNHPVIPIIALLFSFFSKLMLVHHSTNKAENHLASILKINHYFVKEYVAAARSYSLEKVVDNIHHLRKADLSSKGVDSNVEESQILKELIFKLLH